MKRFKLISCEVFYREMCHAVAQSPHIVDIEFLPKGLHDLGSAVMRERVQAALDKVDSTGYDAVLFGYGLCNNGLVGVTAREIPVVLPRAHDPLVDALPDEQVLAAMAELRTTYEAAAASFPTAGEFIERAIAS
jgi:hypothetical protein